MVTIRLDFAYFENNGNASGATKAASTSKKLLLKLTRKSMEMRQVLGDDARLALFDNGVFVQGGGGRTN